MNWKNITLENRFLRQDLTFNGSSAVSYIPLDQVDSFGVVSSENKRWLYAGIFFGACALLSAVSGSIQGMMMIGMVAAAFVAVYFFTRKTWFSITSSQTKFAVEVRTTSDELQQVNMFVEQIKTQISTTQNKIEYKAA